MCHYKQGIRRSWERIKNTCLQKCIDKWITCGHYELSNNLGWGYYNKPAKKLPYLKESLLASYEEKTAAIDKKSEARYLSRKAFLKPKSTILGRLVTEKETKAVKGRIYWANCDWFMVEWPCEDPQINTHPMPADDWELEDWNQTIFWDLDQTRNVQDPYARERYPHNSYWKNTTIDPDTYKYVATGPNNSRLDFNIEEK